MTPISQKIENASKMAILTKKSKIFVKAKLTVSKSYLLRLVCFMISCIFRMLPSLTRYFSQKGNPRIWMKFVFPYTFGPSFISFIGFWRYSSKILNPFLAHCDIITKFTKFGIDFQLHNSEIAPIQGPTYCTALICKLFILN